ncbi:MAG: hypothetical protein IT438_16480 [Phycisphaerales bacterium]|nr:hypothetical protein [Phycisphaerales bacterium]
MGIITALGGILAYGSTAQSSVRRFTINKPRAAIPWSPSGAAGMKSQLAGNTDWSGSASIYGYIPSTLPGETFTLNGQTDSAGGGTKWTGAAIMESLTVNTNTEAAEPIQSEIAFRGNGALSAGTGAVADSANPGIFSSISLGVTFNGSAVAAVRGWSLNIQNDLQQYTTSDDAGIVKRKAGNLSGGGSFTVYEAAPASVLAPGDVAVLRLHVTGSLYWQLTYAQILDFTHEVPIEDAGIIPVTYNFAFTGHKLISTTWTRGSLAKPDTTNFWS